VVPVLEIALVTFWDISGDFGTVKETDKDS